MRQCVFSNRAQKYIFSSKETNYFAVLLVFRTKMSRFDTDVQFSMPTIWCVTLFAVTLQKN